MVLVPWSSVKPLGQSMLEVTKMRRLDPSIQAFSIRPMLSLTSSSSQSVQYIQLSQKTQLQAASVTDNYQYRAIWSKVMLLTSHFQTKVVNFSCLFLSLLCPHFLTLILDGCACSCPHQPPPVLISYQSIYTWQHMSAGFFWKRSVQYHRELQLAGSVLYTHGKAWLCSLLNL